MKFKPGQEVLFKKTDGNWNEDAIFPPDNSIVTIHSEATYYDGFWRICEYLNDKAGDPQAFNEDCLHPLISSSTLQKALEQIEVYGIQC